MNKIHNIITEIKNGDEKTKNLIGNILISFGLKGMSVILNLLIMPLYINFFNDNIILGIWFTIMSLLNYICSFDIGIGNGLRNYLVEPLQNNNKEEIKKIISTSYISMITIGMVIIIIFIAFFNFIPWNFVLNIKNNVDMNDIRFMIISIFIGVIIHFMLNLINSICYSMQKPFVPSFILNITNLIVIIGLYLYRFLNFKNKIIYVSILNVISITIPYVIFTVLIFSTKLKGKFISFKYFDKAYLKKILGLGSKFLYLQILSLLFFSSNEYLINLCTSSENVVTFQIYNKIFYAVSALFSMMLVPLWSAVKEAIVQKDYMWIKKIYKKINLIWIVTIPFMILIVLLYKYIVKIWIGDSTTFSINYIYLIIFAIYYFLYMKVNIISNFIAGMEKLKNNGIVMTTISILKLVIVFIVFNYSKDWIFIIVISLILLIPYILIVEKDIIKELKNERHIEKN